MPKLVFLPPQTEQTQVWAAAVREQVPRMQVVVAEDLDQARRELAQAEAAFGTLSPELLAIATNLQWLQAPNIAPPAGYFSAELLAHPVTVTNYRDIFNE